MVDWLRSKFSPTQLLTLAILLIAGLALRWTELGLRPVHHDESLHMMYGRYFYDFPDIQYYKYDPMLHGPFIYNLMRLAYSTFGSTTEGARAFIALFGTAVLFAPLFFRAFLSARATVMTTAIVALSPNFVYWSRFVREDCMILFWLVFTAWGALAAPKAWRGAFVAFGFAMHACLKENVFVLLAILLGWLVYEALVLWLVRRRDTARGESIVATPAPSLATTMFRHLRDYPIQFLTGLFVSSFAFYYLYSEGFRYPQGPTDFFTKSFSYWLDQHNKERIVGPFNFHVYVLSWYESPLMLALLYGWYRFIRSARIAVAACSGYIILAALLCALYTAGTDIAHTLPWSIINLKDSLDVFVAVLLLGHSVLIPTWHLLRNERALAFWGYLFLSHFFTYCYLGEKVPWLTVYPLITGVAYLAVLLNRVDSIWESRLSTDGLMRFLGILFGVFALVIWVTEPGKNHLTIEELDKLVKFCFAFAFGLAVFSLVPVLKGPSFGTMRVSTLVTVLFLIWSTRAAILTNYTYAGHAREYLSQVHTTPEFSSLVKKIRAEIEAPVSGKRPTVCASGEMTWPITWYFVGINEYMFPTGTNQAQCDAATYRFVDKEFADRNPTPTGYVRYDLPLRGWFVPDLNRMTPRAFLNYALNHTPWSDTGFSWTTVYVKQ